MSDSELAGRTFLVTGANTGIGRVTAVELARRGGRVFVGCRSAERAAEVLEEIRAFGGSVELVEVNLGSFESVRCAAAAFLGRGEPLHVLVNNAGIAGQRGITADGFELGFGVNHLGPFLLTRLLLPQLRASAPSRIVNVSSSSHYRARGIDFDAVRRSTPTLTGLPEYEVSKLCNVLFASELARRLQGSGVVSCSLHPGTVASDIWRRVPWPVRPLMQLFMLTNEQGAQTTLHCATADDVLANDGAFYSKARPRRPSAPARDEALARRLWEQSSAWVGLEP